ncbi:MAG: single-stranded DNA-binding protein [Clostridia bacterium]|nr:single-stranded DNA-binding protein [Clostridia bacterium]
MNKVELIGRLTRDPDVRYTQSQEPMAIARFTIAVDRRLSKAQRDKGGTATADFISCVAFGKNGEFVEKYFSKGMKIALTGRIQTGSYDHKDGYKVYTTDVVCEEFDFCESKGADAPANNNPPVDEDGFMSIPDGIDEELPFN